MLAGIKAVLSLEAYTMEFGNWFEFETKEGNWPDDSEVLDEDKWEIEEPETEVKKSHLFVSQSA